jgi:hydroxymethylglutaryl-CoA synthase
VYDAGNARPTGGVGAVACLIGPNAPLSLVPRSRASHAVDVYDFYKPSMSSEYPAVDGKLSQVCYLRAVDDCYNAHLDKAFKSGNLKNPEVNNGIPSVDTAFDHNLFHSPYNKLVQQSFKRMLYNDARRFVAAGHALPEHLAPLAPFASLPVEKTYANKDLDKALGAIGADLYAKQVGPTVGFSQNIGNSYTGALWTNLACTVDSLGSSLDAKRLGLFSYGSGALATMFSMDGHKKAKSSADNAHFSLDGMKQAMDLQHRLASRKVATPEEFTEALAMRERSYGKSGYMPAGSIENVPKGGWYLKEVTGSHARVYERK